MTIRLASLLLAASLLLQCGGDSSPTAPAVQRLPLGNWGGAHIGLVVAESGATVEFDCATGTIVGPIILEAGRFDLIGVYIQGHGGPIRVDEPEDRHPARYFGTSDGTTMSVTVRLLDNGREIGTFVARRGGSPGVVKCL